MTAEEKLHAAVDDVTEMVQGLWQEIAAKNHLIKLVAPDIEAKEKLVGLDPRLQEIVNVYQEILNIYGPIVTS
ncbi:MAG TPA: hypothetical protein DD811_02270 [Syntrophomonas sp.]|jgi:hypothetical protein|nr:hypothetical protein [Syntrophomonas sp.]